MERQSILEAIKLIISKKERYSQHFSTEKINENTSIVHDMYMDSIQILELVVDIEEYFQIQLDFEQIEASDFQTVGNIINVVLANQVRG